jgi:hypothetical protein
MSRGDLHVWRPPAAVRWSEAVLGGLLFGIGLGAVAVDGDGVAGWAMVLPAVVLLLGTRRACRLRPHDVVAQGRVFRRVMPLAGLRQLGVSPEGRPWLQAADGTVTLLRMLSLPAYGSADSSPSLVAEVRRAAQAAGADLEPPLQAPERPPTTKPLMLGI